jgi:hypothetical protein
MKPRLLSWSHAVAVGIVLGAGAAQAVPGTYPFVDDPRCDPDDIALSHELGNPPPVGPFPPEEAIDAGSTPVSLPIACPLLSNDPMFPDFLITITNLTDTAWTDLFFVADEGIPVGNADGTILDGDAFRIDTEGVNAPLTGESIDADLVFDPGETWTFLVIDWGLVGAFPTPFASIGVGADSDTGASWASIVAIPEPATFSLVALGLAVLARSARRKPTLP